MDGDFDVRVEQINPEMEKCLIEAHRAKVAGDETLRESWRARLFELYLEQGALLRRAGAKFTKLLKVPEDAGADQRAGQLLEAFALGATLERLWKDTKGQARIAACCGRKVYRAAAALERIGEGRSSDLTVLLDNKDLNVRAKAAECLLKLMPDRCLPILEEIHRTERWLCAGSTAYWALEFHKGRMGNAAEGSSS